MLPGLDGTGLLFERFIKVYQGDTEVISLPESGAQDHESLAKAILERLPEEDFVLLAESFSGGVAACLLRMGPVSLRGVIFVASFLTPPNRAMLFLAETLPLKALAGLPHPRYLHKLLFLGGTASDRLVEEFVHVARRIPAHLLKQRIGAMSRMRLSGVKSELPVYYIQAMQDRLIGRRHWRVFKQIYDDVQLYQLPGPHFILQAEPRITAKLVAEMVLEIEGGCAMGEQDGVLHRQ